MIRPPLLFLSGKAALSETVLSFGNNFLAPPSFHENLPFCATAWSAILLSRWDAARFTNPLIKPISVWGFF